MPLSFEFSTAQRVLFGLGRIREVPALAAALGGSVLLVTGSDPRRSEALAGGLRGRGLEVRVHRVSGEPQIEDVELGVATVKGMRLPVVVGFGGGSVMDAAKAMAIVARQDGTVLDYLEVVGAGKVLKEDSLPCVTIPTTAGTGAEVTRNSVLTSGRHLVKASLRSPAMLPKLAVVDPELCLGLPASVLAATGMDALTQLIEPLVSVRANPTVDALCLEGMKRSARSLVRAWENPADVAAREDLSLASLHSGWALSNAGLGAVHGLAAPIGGMFKAPHGSVCAALLAPVMRANLAAMRARAPEHPSIEKYRLAAQVLTGEADVSAEDGVSWVEGLAARLKIQPLRNFGLSSADWGRVVDAGMQASSMKANPLVLERSEIHGALERAT